ncbi:hypothetical protein [Flavobacterium tegetincola]|uniref:hypothetical protein n=1 Tax=Flavobacterium tegetincola TaxID=150172 RepID=UPI0012F7D53B|nr:hypothetical protein [Flavobacterium tegetincola]
MRNIFIEFGNEDSQDLFILEPPHYNVIDITFRGIEIYTTNHEDLVTREEITDYIKEWFNIYIEALQHLKF